MLDRNSLAIPVGVEPEHYGRSPSRRDRVAITCGDRSVTWAQLGDQVHRLARAWEKRGFAPGAKVATFLANSVEVIEVMYSLGRARLANVTINAKYKPDEFAAAFAFSDATALVVDVALLPVLDQAITSLPDLDPQNVFAMGETDGAHAYSTFEQLLDSGDDAPIERAPDENDIVWMAFTGGTTGKSKACMASQRAMVRLWESMALEMDIRRTDIGLIAGSLNHGVGINFGMALLHLGGSLVVLPQFSPTEALEAIEKERITFFPTAPSLFNMVLDTAAAGDYDLSSMRLLVTGGAPVTTATKLRLMEQFPNAGLCSGYGGTESGLFSVVYPEDQMRNLQSVGVAPLGGELAIFDEDGKKCPPGQVGTIYQRGWRTAVEYYKNTDATDAQFLGEWYTLEDMGYLDDEGFLYITDRRKNMIVSSGVNVFPAEVEETLTSHPDVAEAAVIAVPDDKWGELVCAVVVLRPGSKADADTLDTFCRERMARDKLPRRYEFRTELPKTFAGKISHREIREPFWAGRSTRVS